jgi:hypothetical protein
MLQLWCESSHLTSNRPIWHASVTENRWTRTQGDSCTNHRREST